MGEDLARLQQSRHFTSRPGAATNVEGLRAYASFNLLPLALKATPGSKYDVHHMAHNSIVDIDYPHKPRRRPVPHHPAPDQCAKLNEALASIDSAVTEEPEPEMAFQIPRTPSANSGWPPQTEEAMLFFPPLLLPHIAYSRLVQSVVTGPDVLV